VSTLFISDLHLEAARPDITGRFIDFLQGPARRCEALYILGDLFESWVGDDAADESQSRIVGALRQLTAHGVPCFIMHGNRDFLLGEAFCRASGTTLLGDPLLLTLYGRTLLVMHGDALCSDDQSYQRLRATVRDTTWQQQFLGLSIEQRRFLAGAARAGSQAHTATIRYEIADVNAASVELALRHSGTDTLLHGHTHRPAVHRLNVDGRDCTRIVLGDWYTQQSVLEWTRGGFDLRTS
jgi:UDP-2,3-diacylglucosamine hydrolase